MREADIKAAAQALLGARRGTPIAALPEAARPGSEADAYAIQDAVVAELGRVGGWKVGAPSETATPACAPILADRLYASSHRVPANESRMRGVEAEIAFRFGRALPGDRHRYTLAEVTAAIETAMPVIEICETRYKDHREVDPLSLLADSNSNSGLVLGAPWGGWQQLDAHEQRVRLDIGVSTFADQRGGNSAGEPLRLLVWLANHVAARGCGLAAGDVVTTGAWTGLRFASAGDTVQATFAGIGSVSVSYA